MPPSVRNSADPAGDNSMKVLAINASPRPDGNTATMLRTVLQEAEKAGLETELVQLGGHKVSGCRACMACQKMQNGHCAIDDDIINSIIDKMLEADAIVLEEKDIPQNTSFEKHIFALRAVAVYVNANNTCTGLSRQELTQLLALPRPTWKKITGNRVDIHLYGLSEKADGYGLFSRLVLKPDFQIKSPVFRTASTNNVIRLCAGNPVAMGIALFQPTPMKWCGRWRLTA